MILMHPDHSGRDHTQESKPMGLMDGKTGLIVGIANERSYAYYIAESLIREGATCLFTHLPGEKM